MSQQMDVPFLKDVETRKRPPRLHHPLDAIMTIVWREATLAIAFAALDAGIQLGANSHAVSLEVRNGTTRRQWSQRLPIAFVDNEYRGYDHGRHLSVVAHIRPKYATTRDYMTPRQCEAAGIEYFTLDQILTWAEELERYAENVIIIPKEDVLHEIPERYVLGYSVPTAYGATPLPIETFRGRRIHLLGGSWKAQRALLATMLDDVVSIDFNALHKAAGKGQIVLRNGDSMMLKDLRDDDGRPMGSPSNQWVACCTLSLGQISAALESEYLPALTDGPIALPSERRLERSIPRQGTRRVAFTALAHLEEEV